MEKPRVITGKAGGERASSRFFSGGGLAAPGRKGSLRGFEPRLEGGRVQNARLRRFLYSRTKEKPQRPARDSSSAVRSPSATA